MKLSNFEEFVDDVILKRGKRYFEDGHVENIEEIGEGKFIVEVIGNDFYKVNITLDKNKSIIRSFCDCPYDLGDFCKHEVAAYFALRENDQNPSTSKKKQDNLKNILSSLKKEELINIILDICEENPEIKKQLLYSHSPSEDIVASSKKLIKEYINRYKKRGFIYYDDVDEAMYGAELTLEKAKEYLEQDDIETTVALCLVIIQSMIDMLEYCDDSGGWIGILIEQCFDTIQETGMIHQEHMSNHMKDKLFIKLLNEAYHKRYDGWGDWRFTLLNCAVLYCDTPEKRSEFEKKLNQFLDTKKDSWSSQYDEIEGKLLLLELIQKFDGKEAALQFIHDNVHLHEFREKAIKLHLENKNFEKVLQLCEEGKQVNHGYLGLVKRWREYELKAYIELNNIEKQKEIMLEFLFESSFQYYEKLKELYTPNEWKEKLQEILKKFENELRSPYYSLTYIEILKAENLTEKLLEYCRKNLASIQSLYPYLIEKYKDEVIEMLIKFIELEASNASNRSKYKEVCKKIKQYKNVIGIENASFLIERLKGKYVRRPAFIDELNKIKL